jgi:hypothetical protein
MLGVAGMVAQDLLFVNAGLKLTYLPLNYPHSVIKQFSYLCID